MMARPLPRRYGRPAGAGSGFAAAPLTRARPRPQYGVYAPICSPSGLTLFGRAEGALWVIRPKGSPAITEAEVMAAGKRAGLVDVKVASFSGTHTAEKFVIPRASR